MALHREPDRSPDHTLVSEVDAAALREPRAEQLRGYDWAAEPEVLAQLHDAKTYIAEVVEARFFAVVADGKPVSWTDLYLAGDTAQIEDVGTLESERRKGYASAIVLHAAERGPPRGSRAHLPRRRRRGLAEGALSQAGLRRARPHLRVPVGALVIFSARGLAKRYGSVEALAGVDLEVEEGELVGLLGPTARASRRW